MKKWMAVPAIILLLAMIFTGYLTFLGTLSSKAHTGPSQTGERPNIVFMLVDDFDLAAMSQLPGLKKSMTDQGTTFANNFVNIALCCPSRATTLTGEYAHDTKIFGNSFPSGGYQVFHDNGSEESTIGTWLKDAGYQTALMGKYLNSYPGKEGKTYVPPGWSEWDVPTVGDAYTEYDYSLNENGVVVPYGHDADDYMTTVLDQKATAFIASSAAEKKPFFLYLATYAPHYPATPPPKYIDAFPGMTAPHTASYNEADMTDKPSWLKSTPILSAGQETEIDTQYRNRLVAMLGVQDLVDDVITKLTEVGQLENTYIIFASDNGYHLGQHRLGPGKNTAFDTDLRVPLIIRGPGMTPGKIVTAITGNVDLAPTFSAMAGVQIPNTVAGRSLLDIVKNENTPWRQAMLLEHRGPEASDANMRTDGKGILEPADGKKDTIAKISVPIFTGIRTQAYTYVHYENGEQELYENLSDPEQLMNIAQTTDITFLSALHDWTEKLSTCHGANCRTIEEQAPINTL